MPRAESRCFGFSLYCFLPYKYTQGITGFFYFKKSLDFLTLPCYILNLQFTLTFLLSHQGRGLFVCNYKRAGYRSSASTGVVSNSSSVTRLCLYTAGMKFTSTGEVLYCPPLPFFKDRKFASTGVGRFPVLCHYKTAGMEVASTGVVGDSMPAFVIIAGQGSISTGEMTCCPAGIIRYE